MRQPREFEFSRRFLILLFLAFVIFEVIIFYIGFSLGRSHERTQQEKIVSEEKDQVIDEIHESLKKLTSLPLFQKDVSQVQPQEDRTTDIPTPPSESIKLMQPTPKEEEKIPEKRELTPPPEKKKLYYVQVGLYSVREYAFSTLEEFKQKGYEGIVIPPSSENGSQYYRIAIGGYENREQATKIKLELEQADNTTYYVIQH
ncbi:MAG: SPOR domain-containing protein [Candidatus Aminicenantaceae bacterium]